DFNKKKCCVVKKLSKKSPASFLEIQEGDLLFMVNDNFASTIDLNALDNDSTDTIKSVFYLINKKQQLRIETKSLLLGLKLVRSDEAIEAEFANRRASIDELVKLWENGNWRLLNKLSTVLMTKGKGVLARYTYKLTNDTPAILLNGAALYELGKKQKGIYLIKKYMDKYVHKWPTNYNAIGLYYYGLSAYETGDTTGAISSFCKAYEVYPYEPIVQKIKSLTEYFCFPLKSWQLKQFPVDYTLKILSGTGVQPNGESVSLKERLNSMNERQIFALCLLSNSRGDSIYNEFVSVYRRYVRMMGEGLWAGLHVITKEPEKRFDRPYWYIFEEKAIEENLNLSVLYDIEGTVINKINPQQTPYIFLLNNKGTIIHEGCFDDVEFWDIFAQRE
ncbi:MAG: hypothetical protein L3V56_09855, partial [Candidatus Magnetoovum sp. WYHC-5]|nr:hypothetical protein [Candidatus Magnetoovum sp. WYHC-5]